MTNGLIDFDATLAAGVDTGCPSEGAAMPLPVLSSEQPPSAALTRAGAAPARVSLTLHEVEEHLQCLLDTEEMTEGEDRLAILREIAAASDVAKDKRDAVARFLLSVEAMANAKKSEAKRLADEAATLGRLYMRLEARVLELIDAHAPEPKKGGGKRLEGKVYRLAAQNNPPAVHIEPDAIIPLLLCRIELKIKGPMAKAMLDQFPELQQFATVEPDRAAIKALLANDEPVAGCEMRAGKRLVIR